jgi:hypothetical protein
MSKCMETWPSDAADVIAFVLFIATRKLGERGSGGGKGDGNRKIELEILVHLS